MAPDLRIGLLGPLEVSRRGERVDLGSPKQRLVLTMLAAGNGAPVGLDELTEELWGSTPTADPANGVQNLVSKVRRALGTDTPVESRAGGYALRLPDGALDVERFERLAEGGRAAAESGDDSAAIRAWSAALAEWRGTPFGEFGDREFARAQAARLGEARRVVVESLADAHLRAGRPGQALALLEPLTAAEPFREGAWERLILALYRQGRQADALAAHRSVRRALADELGLEPGPRLRTIEARVLSQDPELGVPPPTCNRATAVGDSPDLTSRHYAEREPALGNLPRSIDRFVGRREELARLVELVGEHRLLTLWGPGGVGKTRLSVEVAERAAAQVRDGAWFVDLAPLDSSEQVPIAVANALGMVPGGSSDPIGELVEYLRHRNALLVVDNCEHVVAAAFELTQATLRGCAHVRVLATSREPLNVAGECLWPARTLALPDPDADLDAVAAADAVALFCDRVALAYPGFALTQANAAAVVEICRRLDGIPLALELAAPRVRALGVNGIAAHLGDRFRLLRTQTPGADPRHATLQATVQWSYQLLPPGEQELLAALSVFPAGFDLPAAESVAGSAQRATGFDVLDLLTRLVDRSLVVAAHAAGSVRYRLRSRRATPCGWRSRVGPRRGTHCAPAT